MSRIILAKYNPKNEKCYEFLKSDSNADEKLHIIEDLEPGEYHLFGNVNWTYDTKCVYTISTYADNPVEIEKLERSVVPENYLSMILASYLEKFTIPEKISNTVDYYFSDDDNDTGFYMATFRNNSKTEGIKLKFECSNKESIQFLSGNETREFDTLEYEDGTFDSVTIILEPNSQKTLVWRLLQEYWNSRFALFEPKYEVVPMTEFKPKSTIEVLRTVIEQKISNLEKDFMEAELFYSELEHQDKVFMIFENKSNNQNYRLKIKIPEMRFVKISDGQSCDIDLPARSFNFIILDRTDIRNTDYYYRFTYLPRKY
jgi:hypothetical protein